MKHKVVVWILIGLATVLALVSSLTLYVNRQLLDNKAWNRSSADLVQDPQVRSALSVFLVNSLYQNVDVAAALQQRLPKGLEPLAAPAAAALRQPAASTVNFMLTRPRVQSLFINASGVAHQKLINVLENKTGHGIATGNGNVTLDLASLVRELGAELGLPSKAVARISTGAGTVTLMKSSQLGTAQKAVQLIHVLSVWLLVAVLVLYGVAIYLAEGGRRQALRGVAWSFLLLGVLLLVIRKLTGNYVTHGLAPPQYRQVAHVVWVTETTALGDIGWALVFYGIAGLIAITLGGPTRVGQRVRGWIAPTLNERQGWAWGAVAGIWLLLIFWGGTHALRTWWGIVLIGALLALGLVALRRQTLAEAGIAPAAPPPAKPGLVTK
jgi:hypothetical protein